MDLVYDYQEGRDEVKERLPFDIEKLLNAGVVFITPAIDGDPDSPTYKKFTGEDYSHLITLYNLIHSPATSWVRTAVTKMGDVRPYKNKFWEKIYDGKYNQILWSLEYLDLDPMMMIVEDPLDEQVSKVKEIISHLVK